MLLKFGSQGPDVSALIADLRTVGFSLPPGNLFDATVKRLRMNEGFQCDLQAETFRRPGRAIQLPLL